MCPEEETGRSSAGPWSTPRARACRRSSSVLAAGGIRGRLGLASAAAVADDEVGDPDDDRREDRVVQVVQLVLPVLPVVADLLADEPEREHPGQAAQRRERREAPEGH